MSPRLRIAALVALLVLVQAAAAAEAPPRPSYGRQEHVRVVDATPIEVIAALEPGAELSILNAVDIKYFQREADTWVRFTIDNGSVLQGNHVTLERPVLKDYKVRQPGGGYEHQPRIAIELCLGVQDFKTEVRLNQRETYTAPLVLGQADLSRLGSVDGQRKFTQEPRCVPPQRQDQTLPQNPLDAPKSVAPKGARMEESEHIAAAASSTQPSTTPTRKFRCDGRTSCTQMTSCAEAKFFLQNCPAVKMDGDHDGIPCEAQWCN
ncbi:MAG: hypothetical protein JWR16_1669 [Nevskia sp.]|nr:hypothetical protein [Nevskia sp.]